MGRARRPDGDMWSPSAMHAQVRGRAAEKWLLRPAPCQTELVQERLWLCGLTELCPAIGSSAASKGHGGPTVTGDQGDMAALRLRGRGAGKPMD